MIATQEMRDRAAFLNRLAKESKEKALMDAAPDLLSALQEFVKIVDSLPESDESDMRFHDLYHVAQTAIARATTYNE